MPLTGLFEKNLRLIIFGGKGGVGKTSCALATALALSDKYKTLIISTDPAHSVSDSLEQSIGYSQQRVKNIDNLSAIEIQAEKAYSEFKEKYENELRRIFETSTSLDDQDIQEMMSLSIPGIDEVMSFKTIIDLIDENKYEKYVVDTAPTGHLLRLISSPKLLDGWIKMAAKMRWKYRYMVESFSGSYHPDDADNMLLKLKKTVKNIETLLSDQSRCEFIPVCIPEAMAILETQRLLKELAGYKIYSKHIILNNVMVSDGSLFCENKKKSQQKYIDHIRDAFGDMDIIKVPLFSEEIKGLQSLRKIADNLF